MKRHITFLLTALTYLLAAQCVFGQQGSSIDSLAIIPANPTDNDEIKLICYSTFTSGACFLDTYTTDIQDGEITVMLNYTVGVATVICHSIDTLSIGTLSANTYELTANLTINDLEAIFDTDTINITVSQGLAINNISKQDQFEIYPNPCRDELTIKSMDGVEFNLVEIYSLLGHNIHRQKMNEGMHIDLSHLTDGWYVVILTSESGIQFKKKLIKQTL